MRDDNLSLGLVVVVVVVIVVRVRVVPDVRGERTEVVEIPPREDERAVVEQPLL